MIPRIVTISEKLLLGMRITISFADYRVGELWQRFLPRRKEITNNLSNDLLSMAIYRPEHFSSADPTQEFEKWAAVEVAGFQNLPAGMETFVLPGGLYAVFSYKGLSTDTSVFQYIFGTWLPSSGYRLDDRPHFEVLGDNYRNNDLESEEEIWIPVKAV